jgi:hypothetical protein
VFVLIDGRNHLIFFKFELLPIKWFCHKESGHLQKGQSVGGGAPFPKVIPVRFEL